METNIQKALQKRIVAHKEGKLHEAERMKQEIDSDRKIFEKKIRRTENSDLTYLIDPKEKY
tara:strand:+ start:830 stop:1012 length:183 start_codon:yes stop_codon:yes gene_type:complete